MPVSFKLDPVKGPFVILIIMDGLGLGKVNEGNSVWLAKSPNLDQFWTHAKTASLNASADGVGLPQGVPGNSEVGHLNIGSGQVLYQIISKLNDLVASGEFANLKVLNEQLEQSKREKKDFHLMGLLSASGVHADIRHLFAIMEVCAKHKVDPYLHLFLDGRDTEAKEAFRYMSALNARIKELGIGRIASMSGRFWAMDRNNTWERTEKAYRAMIGAEGPKVTDPMQALQAAYQQGQNDETFVPVIITDQGGKPIGPIKQDDYVLFYNFREDRARQITKVFAMPDFHFFENRPIFTKHFITMTGYEAGLPVTVLFDSDPPKVTLADVIANAGMRQLHMAETEKYAHVTYFFNGGREEKHPNEEFIIIPSPKVVEYATVPEMSAYPLRDEAVSYITKRLYNFVLINFANPDMVGHSGLIQPTKRAVEVTDECVRDVIKAGLSIGARIILSADHGNSEQKIDPVTGLPDKRHTINPVPFMIIDSDPYRFTENAKRRLIIEPELMEPVGVLSDIGTTVLSMLGLDIPPSMTGINLLDVIS